MGDRGRRRELGDTAERVAAGAADDGERDRVVGQDRVPNATRPPRASSAGRRARPRLDRGQPTPDETEPEVLGVGDRLREQLADVVVVDA